MKASTTTDKPIASSTLIVPRPRSELLEMTRRIVQLLLAAQTFWALLFIPLGVVLYKIAVHFELPLSVILLNHLPLLVLAAGASLGLIFGARLRAGADQFFFSRQYRQDQLLVSLLDQIANFNEVSEVIYHTCQALNEVYQATPLHFFFRARETRDLKLVYSYGVATEIMQIPEDAQLRVLLKREGRVLEYPFPAGLRLPPTEQAWLEHLQARLLVPMTGKDHRLLGLITLGERRSAPAYSPNDYVLLGAIGEQIARRMELEERRSQISEQAKAPLATLARLEAQMMRQKSLEPTEEPTPLANPYNNANNANNDNNDAETEKLLWI